MTDKTTYVSVTALNRYIHYKFENDVHLKKVYLKGEISNFKGSKKHFYFSIKDEESEISAMMFYPTNTSLLFELKDGVKVLVEGSVGVYQKKGTYSINVTKMTEDGIGELYQRFLLLKEKLASEGLFDDKWKKPLPQYPEHVAVITSATGDAVHDIVSTFDKRFPLTKIYLYPALVQGSEAPKDLVRALKKAYEDQLAQCIIIGRGGGSFEDLSCFNDETLARVLFASPIPTISAVGHEADYTICDFVASHRAPTPTGAAMHLTKHKDDITREIQTWIERLNNDLLNKIKSGEKMVRQYASSYGLANFQDILASKERSLSHLRDNLENHSPKRKMEQYSSDLDNYNHRLKSHYETYFDKLSVKLEGFQKGLSPSVLLNQIQSYQTQISSLNERSAQGINQTLEGYEVELQNLIDKSIILNPLNLMSKGYSIVYKEGSVVTSIHQIQVEDELNIKFHDGEARSKVLKIEKRVEHGKEII